MKRKQHLIAHPPSASMSLRQELRALSVLLRDCKDPDTAIRLTKRMDAIRAKIKPPVKRPVGRPKKLKPEPVVVKEDALQAVIEREKARRDVMVEPPAPSSFEQMAEQLKLKAQSKEAGAEEARRASGIAPYLTKDPIIGFMRAVSRPLDDNEVFGCVGQTNALLHNFDRPPDATEPTGEGGWLSDGMGHLKKG